MREIKFRGKRINNGEWIYGDLHHGFMTKKPFVDGFAVCPSTVGQFTGLKDKNGKEIYEGDIVKTVALLNDHHQRGAIVTSPVEYFYGAPCLSITHVPLSLDFVVAHDIYIIGNIHDNPDLLQDIKK